jgi:plastocyanin
METSKVIIAVVILLLLGGGAYFYFQNNENDMDGDDAQMMQSAEPATSPAAMTADDTMMASGEGAMEAGVKEFTVNGSNFKFEPSVMTVNKGDKVKITFKNTGGFHDFVIDEFDGAKTKQIGANASETIEFVADKTGSFEYYCSVGNHRGMGMKGTLTVK